MGAGMQRRYGALGWAVGCVMVGSMMVGSPTAQANDVGLCTENNQGFCGSYKRYESCGAFIKDWPNALATTWKAADRLMDKGYAFISSPPEISAKVARNVYKRNKHLDPQRNGVICEFKRGQAAEEAPPAPTNLIVLSQELNGITLEWTAPPRDTYGDIVYQVTHDGNDGPRPTGTLLGTGDVDSLYTRFQARDLTPGKSYTFTVTSLKFSTDKLGYVRGGSTTVGVTFQSPFQEAHKTVTEAFNAIDPTVKRYSNCAAARDAGVIPMVKGTEVYAKNNHLDLDLDGVACE